jgi:ribosomal protein L2
MKKIFIANICLTVMLALAGMAAGSTVPAFAQSSSKFGSALPSHYLPDGTQAAGWYAEVPRGGKVANTASTFERGKNAYAQVPATILNFAAPPGCYRSRQPAQ